MKLSAVVIGSMLCLGDVVATDWYYPDPITYEWTVQRTQRNVPSLVATDVTHKEVIRLMGNSMTTPIRIRHDIPQALLDQTATWELKDVTWLEVIARVADATNCEVVIGKGEVRLVHQAEVMTHEQAAAFFKGGDIDTQIQIGEKDGKVIVTLGHRLNADVVRALNALNAVDMLIVSGDGGIPMDLLRQFRKFSETKELMVMGDCAARAVPMICETFPNLRSLSFWGENRVDLSQLGPLAELREFECRATKGMPLMKEDVSRIEANSKLERIVISLPVEEHLDSLKAMPNLKELVVEGKEVELNE